MIAKRENPFLARANDPGEVTPAPTVETPATPEAEPEKENEEEKDKEDEAAADTPPESPETPEEPVAKLSAFQRGALRMLGKGDLVAKIEAAEARVTVLEAALDSAIAENAKLKANHAEAAKEAEARVEAAAKAREEEVARKVRAELAALGIHAEAAPGQVSPDHEGPLTLQQFNAKTPAQRMEYIKKGGKITD